MMPRLNPTNIYNLFNMTPEALLEQFSDHVGVRRIARRRVTARNTLCSGNMSRVNLLCGGHHAKLED